MEEYLLNFIRKNIKINEDESEVIENLISDSTISEIMVNSYDEIFFEKKGRIYKSNKKFSIPENYGKYVRDLLIRSNKTLNENNPILDFEHDNMRINLIKESVANDSPVLTIRKKSLRNASLDELLESGTLDEESYSIIIDAIGRKRNVFISGGTSSGKTTLLNAAMNILPKDERIVIIEDTREIEIKGSENAVYLTSRKALYDLKEVTLADLVKTSLRMRPDRIILGEIRRDEVVELLHVLNSGHSGSFSTGHATSALDMILRLKLMLLEKGISEKASDIMIHRGIDIIIHMERDIDRKVKEILSLDYKDDKVVIERIY